MKTILAQLALGQSLSKDQTIEAFELIMTGQAEPAQIGALLGMIQLRGPSVDEITGAATVMRDKATKVEVPDDLTVIDTCGTGGDDSGTFNISTAAALVAAAAGRPKGVAVAKHGNRAVTSRSGSSQVLESLGVNLHVQPQTLSKCLDEVGLCFCFAPAHHPAMKYAGPIRAALGFRTIFNVLGPLTNPAGARRQVMGVFDRRLTEPIATVLQNLGAEAVMVVHGSAGTGSGGLDELSTMGPTQISQLKNGVVETYELDPTSLGLTAPDPSELEADGPESSAQVIRYILDGKPGPAKDIVMLNAAAALVVAGVAEELADGLAQADEAIENGSVSKVLEKLVTITQTDA
jgi:anthranilate phosphoribosyltransferase